VTLTLLFRFNDAGLIDSVRAKARGGMVGNKIVMMPWESKMSDYEVRDRMTVPITGEAAWLRTEGRNAVLSRHYQVADLRVCAVMTRTASCSTVASPTGASQCAFHKITVTEKNEPEKQGSFKMIDVVLTSRLISREWVNAASAWLTTIGEQLTE
jgi:hypothetical protein